MLCTVISGVFLNLGKKKNCTSFFLFPPTPPDYSATSVNLILLIELSTAEVENKKSKTPELN